MTYLPAETMRIVGIVSLMLVLMILLAIVVRRKTGTSTFSGGFIFSAIFSLQKFATIKRGF